MEIIINNYDHEKYFSGLKNAIFKLLPVYEGKVLKSPETVIPPDQALLNYQKELGILETKVLGGYKLYKDEKLLDVLELLRGMEDFKVGEHPDVKKSVFSLLNKIEGYITQCQTTST